MLFTSASFNSLPGPGAQAQPPFLKRRGLKQQTTGQQGGEWVESPCEEWIWFGGRFKAVHLCFQKCTQLVETDCSRVQLLTWHRPERLPPTLKSAWSFCVKWTFLVALQIQATVLTSRVKSLNLLSSLRLWTTDPAGGLFCLVPVLSSSCFAPSCTVLALVSTTLNIFFWSLLMFFFFLAVGASYFTDFIGHSHTRRARKLGQFCYSEFSFKSCGPLFCGPGIHIQSWTYVCCCVSSQSCWQEKTNKKKNIW